MQRTEIPFPRRSTSHRDHDPAPSRHLSLLWMGLLMLLCVLISVVVGLLIVGGEAVLAVPVILAVPTMILFLRYPFAAVMIWMLVFPYVALDPSAAGRLIYWLVHRAMIPGTLGLVLVSNWLRIHNKHERIRWGRAELVMLIFLGLVVVNILLVSDGSNRAFIRFYDRLIVPFCMYWLVRMVAPSERDLQRFTWVALITVAAQSAIGLIGWFAPSALPPQWIGRQGERVVGTFGNPAVFTSTLIFLALFLLQRAMQGQTRLRPLLILAFSLAFISVFFSFSRGSWLGGLLVWIGLMFVYRKVMLGLTLAAIIVALPLAATVLVDQLTYASQRLNDTDTAQGRVLGAVTGLRMVQAKPWLGWGYNTYDIYDEQFKTRVAELPVREEQTSHNTYILITAELGIVGLVLYLFPVGWWLLLSKKVWRRLPQHGLKSWHWLAMLWLLLLDHVVVSNFMAMIDAYPLGTTVWWMALGLIASQVYPYLAPRDLGAPRWATRALEPVQVGKY